MQRYRAIVDNAAEGILLISWRYKTILEANPASIQILGYTGDELTGMNFSHLILATVSRMERGMSNIFAPDGWSGEVHLQRQDGSLRDVVLISRIILRQGEPALSCVVVHDITERKLVEEAVRQVNKNSTFSVLQGTTSTIIWRCSRRISSSWKRNRPGCTR